MTITAEGLRSRRRRTRLSQDIPPVNHNNCCQNGLSLQQIYTLHPAGLRTPWRSQPCAHCGALLLTDKSSNWCCSGGRKILTHLPPLPTRIEHLVAENSTDIA